ncbi:CoA transferase [bacterium]|nr:CoA transferase [bacterium]
MNSKKTLANIKVLELSQFVAGPYCASMLAHLGADVIKVERPQTGDQLRHVGPFLHDEQHLEKSGMFLYLNRNKSGITLNYRTEKGRDLLSKLLREMDILIDDLAPSQRAEVGLNFDDLHKLNPRLIVTTITPFGQTGPYKDFKARDLNIQAISGLTAINGDPDNEPLRIPGMQSHFQSALNAAIGTLAALFYREISGRGQFVDISEMECTASILGDVMSNASMLNQVRKRSQALSGAEALGMVWPIGNFQTSDGYVNACLLESHQWKGLLEVFGNPEWGADPSLADMFSPKDHVDTSRIVKNIKESMSRFDKETLFREAQKYRVPLVSIKNTAEVLASPQLRECEFFEEMEHPIAGKLTYPGAPFKMSVTPWQTVTPAPLLGQHNALVYGKLGITQQQQDQLLSEHVI